MMKKLIIIILFFSTFTFSQTSNDNLNKQLSEMKNSFLKGNYDSFANYTYPILVEMMGGKSNFVKVTKNSMDQIKTGGYNIKDIKFKKPSNFVTKKDELQCSLIQEILLETPKGKILAEYTLIAISEDKGNNWTFLDTSGKSKSEMLEYFPNLSSELIIIDKTQKFIN